MEEISYTHPHHAIFTDCRAACPEAFVVVEMWDLVAPELGHVETLGVPDVCLEPDMCSLSSLIF